MAHDERPKLSWREIDKRRESGSSSSGRPSGSQPGRPSASQEDHRQKQYRAALEAAFAKGELGKLADKLNLLGRGGPPAGTNSDEKGGEATNGGSAAATPTSGAAATPASGQPLAATATATAPDEEAGKKGGKKKPVEDKLSLRRKLLEAAGRQEITRIAEKYLARWPLPDDPEFLEQLLEHEKETRIREALDRLGILLDRGQMPRRSRALCGKLRYISETGFDPELQSVAQNLLTRLG